MSAFDERRSQDLQKLHELARQSRGRIQIIGAVGTPPHKIDVELGVKTAPSADYPKTSQSSSRVSIVLPARYPFVEPKASILTPIFHPNVYGSGAICFGVKWLPSYGLDFLVKRVIQIITFDPTVLNLASPANAQAASWYKSAVRNNPTAFPTDHLEISAVGQTKVMSWKESEAATVSKTIVTCISCDARLSIPGGRSGTVKCPKCGGRVAIVA